MVEGLGFSQIYDMHIYLDWNEFQPYNLGRADGSLSRFSTFFNVGFWVPLGTLQIVATEFIPLKNDQIVATDYFPLKKRSILSQRNVFRWKNDSNCHYKQLFTPDQIWNIFWGFCDMIINYKAIVKLEGKTIDCHGYIEIHSMTEVQAYISWQLFDCYNSSIAGTSKNYFISNIDNSLLSMVSLVIEDIKKFRIGRKHIVREIKIVDGWLTLTV